MVTGLKIRSRRLVMAIIVAAMVLVTAVYGPVSIENTLGLEFGGTAYAEHESSGGG